MSGKFGRIVDREMYIRSNRSVHSEGKSIKVFQNELYLKNIPLSIVSCNHNGSLSLQQ